MIRQCAWCGVSLGAKEGPEDKVTHGICPKCIQRMRMELEMGEEEGKGAIAGLVFATVGMFVIGIWLTVVIEIYAAWPMVAVIMGILFAIGCFWIALGNGNRRS